MNKLYADIIFYMESIKSKVFNYLTSSQKSELCHYLSKFVKKHFGKTLNEIFDLYIQEEEYYIKLDSSRHPWIIDYIGEDNFHKDLILYIKDNQRKYELKEKQKPIIEKQKIYQKEQRKISKDRKMSKEPPTDKQIYYYKALCKKYRLNIELDLENASRLEFKNAIDSILSSNSSPAEIAPSLLTEEHEQNKKNLLLKLQQVIKSKQ